MPAKALADYPKPVGAAMQILVRDVCVHQSRINFHSGLAQALCGVRRRDAGQQLRKLAAPRSAYRTRRA